MLYVTATDLPRIMNCEGSVYMKPSRSNDDPTARDEGNAAHFAALKIFEGVAPDALINTAAYNGHVISADMVRYVSEYVSALDCGQMEFDTPWSGEGFQIAGRCDHLMYSAVRNDLTIDDLKYGFRLVEPDMNWTLISHAVAWCLANNHWPHMVHLRIHQPRPHHHDGKLRTWSITGVDLYRLYERILRTLAAPSQTLTTGVSWCAKCTALPTCPAARAAAMNAIDATSERFDDTVDNDALAQELLNLETASETIKARHKALQELATSRIRLGQVVGDYGFDTQYAHRRWRNAMKASTIRAITGIDVSEPSDDPCTPAEAERRGMSSDVVATLTERPVIGTKLTRMDANKRARRLLKK